VISGNRIQEEAAAWAVKSQWGALTSDEEARLRAWLAADVRHHGAYVRAEATRANIERIAALAGGRVPGRFSPFGRVPVALAAGLGAVAIAVALAWYAHNSGDRYVSEIGELRKVALEDGSSIFLNTATQAVARFDSTEREIDLPQGEALFEVAKDPTRPFVVRVGEVTVTAIGTAFVVRHDGDRVNVVVTEGVVELARPGEPARRLIADQQAIVGADQPIAVQALNRRETERQLAWQTGRVEFDGQPLSDAVAQMNRHNRRQVVIADPALAQRPVVGIFRNVDIETFARIAARALDATVVEEVEIIRIEPRPQ
jgi:transmembrane sensor